MHRSVRPLAAFLLCAGLILGAALIYTQRAGSAPLAQTSGTFADPAFQQVWQRTDLPVQNARVTDRSWTWGPEGFFSTNEPYAQAAGGRHLVQYFDKSRMEINDPNGDRSSQWFVTNGLLVVEMMTGRIATGDTTYTQTVAAQIPVAGDPAGSVNAPTYATLAQIASLNGNNRAADRTGQIVDQTIDKNGNIQSAAQVKEYAPNVVNAVYEPTLGHNIPNVFWTFMNQSGTVYENGQYVQGKIMDWVFAMGYPLTEPYWIQISVGGQNRWVLMQTFQRRVLTYSPQNDPAFQVEMGNVGRTYYDWRYTQQGQVLPSATPVPPTIPAGPAASIAVSPSSGSINTTIEVKGQGFPAYAAVTVGVGVPDTDYRRGLTTAAADANGNFTANMTLPAELSTAGDIKVGAVANGGAVVATADYTIGHNPTLAVDPPETTNVGVIQVRGNDFPANTQITLSAKNTATGSFVKSAAVKTDSSGQFNTTYTLQGQAQVGQQYLVYAEGPGNLQAQSQTPLKIIQQPTAVLQPNHGPVGVNVTYSGSKWQPNRMLVISLEGNNGQTLLPYPPAVTDGAGNFAMQVLIPQDYAGQSQIVMIATDNTSRINVRTPYNIEKAAAPTPTRVPTTAPIPPSPTKPTAPSPTTPPVKTPTSPALPSPTSPPAATPIITVTPDPIRIGESAVVSGQGFPGSSQVNIYVVAGSSPNVTPTGTPVTSIQASSAGIFSAQFLLLASPQNATTVTVIASTTSGGGVSARAVVDVQLPQINPPIATPPAGAAQADRRIP